MKNQIVKFAAVIIVVTVSFVPAFAGNWTNFSNYTKPTGIAVSGNEVWVAAKGGLLRYDKLDGTKKFFIKSTTELPSLTVEVVRINAITNDIWIGTYDNGIAKFDGNTWTQIALPSNQGLYELKIASDGSVWVGTTEALYHYQNGSFTTYLAGSSAPWDFDLFPNGKILCGRNVPFIFDPNTLQSQPISTTAFAYGFSRVIAKDDHRFFFSADHNMIAEFNDTTEVDTAEMRYAADMQFDSNGDLVLLDEDGLLHKNVLGNWSNVSFGNDSLTAFLIQNNNELWAGTANDNCKLFHRNTQNQTEQISIRKSAISSNWVYDLRAAGDGNVLMSSSESVQKFDVPANSFTDEWTPLAPYAHNEAVQVNGKIYLGTSYQYLYEFSNNQWTQLGNGVLPDNEVSHVTSDNSGNVWMCGYGYAAKYDGVNFTVFNSADNYHLTQYTRDIHYDATRNAVWFSTYDGIFKIQNNVVSFYNDSTPGIQQYYDAVETIAEDAAHNIWFGTVYGGIVKFDGTNFSTMLLPETAGNQFVSGIAFIDNAMYVSDNLNGVWKYENMQWDSFNIYNSAISSNYVNGLYADAENNLWISHLDYGVDVYNKNGVTVSKIDEAGTAVAKVYPNPSRGIFLLQVEAEGDAEVKIFSIEGKLISEIQRADSNTAIDLNAQQSGIYFAAVKTKTGASVLKLVKN